MEGLRYIRNRTIERVPMSVRVHPLKENASRLTDLRGLESGRL